MRKDKAAKYLLATVFCLALLVKPVLQSGVIPETTLAEGETPKKAEEILQLNCFLGDKCIITVKDGYWELSELGSTAPFKTGRFKSNQGIMLGKSKKNFVLISKEENKAYCYDLKGNQVWEKVYSLPIKQVRLDEEKCYLHLGSPWGLAEETKTGENFPQEKVVALSLNDGKYLWEYDLKGEAILLLLPEGKKKELALFTADLKDSELKGKFYLLNGEGKLIVEREYGAGPIYAARKCQINDGWIGIGEKEIYYLTFDGVRFWTKKLSTQPLAICQFASGGIGVVQKGRLTCFDEQGQLKWEKKLKDLEGLILVDQRGDKIAIGGKKRVYLLNQRGKLEKALGLKNQIQDLSFDSMGQLLILDEVRQVEISRKN
ncbi:MAG TPA: PQQ-binding-like beta-propeller repeat protein [Clostridia bacterium]|jgi:hypothetical protein|nr:PQQ-binding-like beta-propeller repeat protein [Clostridia bacterium]